MLRLKRISTAARNEYFESIDVSCELGLFYMPKTAVSQSDHGDGDSAWLAMVRAHLSSLFIAATTLMAGVILAIVALARPSELKGFVRDWREVSSTGHYQIDLVLES